MKEVRRRKAEGRSGAQCAHHFRPPTSDLPLRRTAADGISRWTSEAERRAVNEALDRRATWHEIAALCAKHGRKGITAQNVTNYRISAERKAWLAHQLRLDTIRQESELTAAVVRHYSENGGSPAEAGLLAAAETLTKALTGVPPEDLQNMVREDPRKFLSAIESLSRVAAFVQRERAAAKADPAPAPSESPEDRTRKIREIFGLK